MAITLGGTNPAVTFPDATVQNTSAIVSGYVPYANLPAGSVLQVVQGTTTTQVSSSSSTYADTNVTASITPKFSTSKVLILITISGIGKDSSNTAINLKIQKNSSDLIAFNVNSIGFTGGTGSNFPGSAAFNYLDSPATTSATTYKVQFASNNNTSNTFVQLNNGTSSITLLEIAA